MRIVGIVQRQEKSLTYADADRFDRSLVPSQRNDVAVDVIGAVDGAHIERVQGCDAYSHLNRGERSSDVGPGAAVPARPSEPERTAVVASINRGIHDVGRVHARLGRRVPCLQGRFRGNGTKYSARFVYEDGVGTPPDTLGYVVTLFGEDGANGVLSAGHLNGKKVFPVEDDNFVVIEHGYLTIVEAYTRIPGITRPFSWYAEVKDTDNTIATCGTKTTAVPVD
ncbi:MAG: hypothetical protein ACFNYN_02410 [Peptidiphaga gingivicola]